MSSVVQEKSFGGVIKVHPLWCENVFFGKEVTKATSISLMHFACTYCLQKGSGRTYFRMTIMFSIIIILSTNVQAVRFHHSDVVTYRNMIFLIFYLFIYFLFFIYFFYKQLHIFSLSSLSLAPSPTLTGPHPPTPRSCPINSYYCLSQNVL